MRSSSLHRRSAVIGRIGVLVGLALSVGAGVPHLMLKASNPEHDATLTEWPEQVELTFTSAVNSKMSRVTLHFDGSKERLQALESKEDAVLAFAVPEGLGEGAAEIWWVATGSDGHPVDGVLKFQVQHSGAGEARH